MGKKYQKSKQEEKRQFIQSCFDQKMSTSEIIQKDFGKKTTVYRIRKQIKKRKTIKRKTGSKGFKKLFKSHKLKIYNALKINPFCSANDLVIRLNLPVTARTVRNYLKERGFRYRRPNTMIKLNQKQKDLRIDFCKKMKDFHYTNSIIFSDEASFWLHDNNHAGWFHQDLNQELSIDRHAGKVHVWGAISARGKVALPTFTDNLDARLYQDILDKHLIPNAWSLYPNIWYFQQDNDSKHTAGSTRTYLKRNVPHCLDWPSRSPDLNPMENVWKILKGNVRKKQPSTLMELEDYIYEEWNNIENKIIRNLAMSFKNRIEECIRLDGNITHY